MNLIDKYNEAAKTITAIKKVCDSFSIKGDKSFDLCKDVTSTPMVIKVKHWDDAKNKGANYVFEDDGIQFHIDSSVDQKEASSLCKEFFFELINYDFK